MLQAFVAILRREAVTRYRFECLMYALQAPHLGKGSQLEKPVLPMVLRAPKDGS